MHRIRWVAPAVVDMLNLLGAKWREVARGPERPPRVRANETLGGITGRHRLCLEKVKAEFAGVEARLPYTQLLEAPRWIPVVRRPPAGRQRIDDLLGGLRQYLVYAEGSAGSKNPKGTKSREALAHPPVCNQVDEVTAVWRWVLAKFRSSVVIRSMYSSRYMASALTRPW